MSLFFASICSWVMVSGSIQIHSRFNLTQLAQAGFSSVHFFLRVLHVKHPFLDLLLFNRVWSSNGSSMTLKLSLRNWDFFVDEAANFGFDFFLTLVSNVTSILSRKSHKNCRIKCRLIDSGAHLLHLISWWYQTEVHQCTFFLHSEGPHHRRFCPKRGIR